MFQTEKNIKALLILGFIILLAIYVVKFIINSPDPVTYEECVRKAKTAQEQSYCMRYYHNR